MAMTQEAQYRNSNNFSNKILQELRIILHFILNLPLID